MINNGIDMEAIQKLVQKYQSSEQENSVLPMQAHIKWAGGLKHEVRIRDFEPILNDEPQFLGGTDTGANPMEYILGALGSCMGIIFVMRAAGKGVTIENLEIKAEGEIDLRVLMGLKEGNRGFSEIKVTFEVQSPADPQTLQEIYEEVIAGSPVGNTLMNNVRITSAINKQNS